MKQKNIALSSLLISVLLLSVAAFAATAPKNLRATAENNAVVLQWDAVSDVAGYNVYRKEASDTQSTKLNGAAVSSNGFSDPSVTAGKDYTYTVRAIDASGVESVDSAGAGAPRMAISTSATITTLRASGPLKAKSIKTGDVKTFAGPGDVITYKIVYANKGFSSASNVKINYKIPAGTKIAGTPLVKKGAVALVSYFDKAQKRWLSAIDKEENVENVSFLIKEPLKPVASNGSVNGEIDLNVTIEL